MLASTLDITFFWSGYNMPDQFPQIHLPARTTVKLDIAYTLVLFSYITVRKLMNYINIRFYTIKLIILRLQQYCLVCLSIHDQVR